MCWTRGIILKLLNKFVIRGDFMGQWCFLLFSDNLYSIFTMLDMNTMADTFFKDNSRH